MPQPLEIPIGAEGKAPKGGTCQCHVCGDRFTVRKGEIGRVSSTECRPTMDSLTVLVFPCPNGCNWAGTWAGTNLSRGNWCVDFKTRVRLGDIEVVSES
jgi:hypothetical protein